ncbi:MAG: protein kinase domain-containing protein [Gemmatimonadaceae bacterium]
MELLGRGGMGIVFRAREVSLDREVALKVLALDPILNHEAFERFEREAKLAARLDHPNIVPIFAVGQREAIAYYTMRLVRGGSVEDMLARQRQLEYDHVMAVLRDVAAALDYAHGRGVVHRDVKPANILNGEAGHALVADFGIAKALGATAGDGATGTGIIGSPGYMSPEQWRGDVVDGRADQYALGIVAFEMLAGRRPFETPSVQDLLTLHLEAPVPAVSSRRAGIPEHADFAIRRALAKHPGERFSTVTGFVDALAGLRTTAVGPRTQQTPRYEARRRPPPPPPRRTKTRAFLVMLAVLLLLGAGGSLPFVLPRTRAQTRRMAEPYWIVAREQGSELLARVGLTPRTPRGGSSAGDIQASDSIAGIPPVAAIGSEPLETVAGVRSAATEGAERTPIERRPIGFDTVLYGTQPSPFRSAAAREFGFVNVTVQGGAAPIIVDGRELDATAGPLGVTVRAGPGTHYISVRGAGVLFTPSQFTVTVSASDTVAVTFTVPSIAPHAVSPDSGADPPAPAGASGRQQP